MKQNSAAGRHQTTDTAVKLSLLIMRTMKRTLGPHAWCTTLRSGTENGLTKRNLCCGALKAYSISISTYVHDSTLSFPALPQAGLAGPRALRNSAIAREDMPLAAH